jgi:curved DNA-binding protein CbpA
LSTATPSDSAEAEIDLDPEFRAQLRELARKLPELDYYALLGLPRSADAAAVRDAFFQQSKRFHPDRFFRRNLGPYRELITEIYKRMVAAHDVLRDEEQRASYDQSLGPEPAAAPEAPPAPPPPSLRTRTGLRSRNHLLGGLQAQIALARQKAERRFEEAQAQRERGNFSEAAALLRMAMAFAPREQRYRRAFEELAPEANAQQARALRARAELMASQGQAAEAIELLLECSEREPTDAVLADRVARLIVEHRGDLARALELARRALSLDKSSLEFRRTLARVLKASGDAKGARREYQRIWQADPLDAEAKRELA